MSIFPCPIAVAANPLRGDGRESVLTRIVDQYGTSLEVSRAQIVERGSKEFLEAPPNTINLPSTNVSDA